MKSEAEMDLAADLHVHTVASGHAYSTIAEIADEAARKGLDAIAITDHGSGSYTRAVLNALANPYIDGIVHPGNPDFPLHLSAWNIYYGTIVKMKR
jgi:histidinol phosphatase-like PHP family hydrolase